MDDNTVYEFKSAVRGYHFYRKDWKPVCNQLLFCSYEVGNPFDPCKVRIAMDIRTKRQQDVLDRYKELVREFYYEPSDGEEVVGSFVEYTEYEALSMQLPPKKRKLTDKTEHARSKDKSGATDIRNFFTSTRKKTNSVQRNDVNVIELD